MVQIYRGCIRTAEEVLTESPQLQIMRDPPPLIGKRVRYVTVFHFEEEGKPKQSLYEHGLGNYLRVSILGRIVRLVGRPCMR